MKRQQEKKQDTRAEQCALFHVLVIVCGDENLVFISVGKSASADGETATRESLAAVQVSASGERSPAHSAVGVAAFQLAKTTFQFVRAGDLPHHFTFQEMLSDSKRAGGGRAVCRGTAAKPGRGSGCCPAALQLQLGTVKAEAALRRQDVSALLLPTVLQLGSAPVCICW